MFIPEYVCVLDFEATCEKDNKNFENEIIEFPSVLLQNIEGTYYTISEFRYFCKPLKNPILTDFCKNLTGIKQWQVDSGYTFPEVLNLHYEWLNSYASEDLMIVTCGSWDLNDIFKKECKRWNIKRHPKIYSKFINIIYEFKRFYLFDYDPGMKKMMEYLNITLFGRHHSGIDDCRNIANIWNRMVLNGYTTTYKSVIYIYKKKNWGKPMINF